MTTSSLLNSRTSFANLMPLATGLYFFSCLAPVDLFVFGSRVGLTTPYNTTYKGMKALAIGEGDRTRDHASDASTVGGMVSG